MQQVLRQLVQSLRQGAELSYCRLVETRGSTPQKAGALMLVHPDGSQTGTLGGGCVEAEVKRRALAALAARTPEMALFQLDSDYGWDDGLICGGRMHVLIEPLHAGVPGDYFERLAALAEAGQAALEAVVFDEAASGLPNRASFLLDEQARCLAVRHTPLQETPPLLRQHARPLASRPRPYAAQGVGFMPLLARCRLIIVGGGHVGKAVAELAARLDFDIWVIDDREEYVAAERFPEAHRRICGPIEQVLPNLHLDSQSYCLIVTRGHHHDEQALYHLADRGARYVGLIGSRRKIRMIFDDLRAEGVSSEALARVFAPLGIDIGSQTVPEIAVSICAELVAHRNRQGVVPGRPSLEG